MIIPDGMPILTGGQSDDPAKGLCIMQYVALVNGESEPGDDGSITDFPSCTTQSLRDMAIFVNDYSTPEKRQERMMPLVFRLMGTNKISPAQRHKLADVMERWMHRAQRDSVEEYARYLGSEGKPEEVRNALFEAYKDKQASIAYQGLLEGLDLTDKWLGREKKEPTVQEWAAYDLIRRSLIDA